MHKSKTVYKDLNPFWDERFDLVIEDISVPVDIKVSRALNRRFIKNFLIKNDNPRKILEIFRIYQSFRNVFKSLVGQCIVFSA